MTQTITETMAGDVEGDTGNHPDIDHARVGKLLAGSGEENLQTQTGCR